MLIKHTYTYAFDPVKEYEEIMLFETANDMKEWKKSESTTLIAYTKTDVWTTFKKEEKEE